MIHPEKALRAKLSVRQIVLLGLLPRIDFHSTARVHRAYLALRCEKITRQGVDYELRALEKDGYLIRSEHNSYIKITPKGTSVHNRVTYHEPKIKIRRRKRQAPQEQPS